MADQFGKYNLPGSERDRYDLPLHHRSGKGEGPRLLGPVRQPAYRFPARLFGFFEQVGDIVGFRQPAHRDFPRRPGQFVGDGGRVFDPVRFLRQRDHRPCARPAPFRGGTGRVPRRGPGGVRLLPRSGVERFPGGGGRRGRANRSDRHRHSARLRGRGRQPVGAGHRGVHNGGRGGRYGGGRGLHGHGGRRPLQLGDYHSGRGTKRVGGFATDARRRRRL